MYKRQHFYKKSAILCLPALSETWVVLLEAMACGVPVITTSIGSATEFVKNGKNGFLVRYPPNPEEIAEVILNCLLNEDLLLKMSIHARKTAEKYDWRLFAEKLWHIYNYFT